MSDISCVGEHFIVGLRPSPQLDPRDRALLAELRPAGVVLFKSNFAQGEPYERWLAIQRRLIADVRAAIARERLFVAIDHEGGRVCRTPAPITRFGYAAQWASQAGAVGEAMGRELASLGCNLNFAPVLDVHSNPNNPVIGPRAFGRTVAEVSAAALQFIPALERQGVLACGKHFPGHGDTSQDSHLELPVLQQDLGALRERELKPFAAAIRAGVSMLMTSHILLPRIDANAPVTLSQVFNRQLLREEMGFEGVVVTDDIGMGAVAKLFAEPQAAVQLLKSGADLIMMCSYFADTGRCRDLAAAVLEAERQGTLPQAAAARARVQALLARTPQNAVTALSATELQQHRGAGALFQADTAEVI